MKKKRLWILALCLMLMVSLLFTACTDSTEEISADGEGGNMRTIVDLAGNTVELPPASEIEKVVIVAPPLVSVYADVMQDTSALIGVHPWAIYDIPTEVRDQLISNWESIDTTFLTGFASNTEQVLSMDPDIILVYGTAQMEGLENIDIPIVDFFLTDTVNENWSVQIDTLMREIFAIEDGSTLQDEWDEANAIAAEALANIGEEEKKTGLMIMLNTGDTITVRGVGSYGDDWLTTSGLINVAGGIEGEAKEVTMEQIYEWDPDIIWVFQGLDASAYMSNSIDGQDWSQLTAYKNGNIIDTPIGVFYWASPGSDSPLTLQWMILKNYPDTMDEEDFIERMKEYYTQHYNITLTDEMVDAILDPEK